MTSWWPLIVAAALVLVAMALVARAVVRTVAGFVAERRLARVKEAPLEIRTTASLPALESMLLAAEDGLRTVLRGTWREWLGFGNPALRQRELVGAWGELLKAQRSLRASSFGIDPGEDVVLVEDPLHALAARGSWVLWGALMLLPWFVRNTYTLVALRTAVRPLLDRAEALEREVRAARTPAGAPQRLVAVA